MNKKRGSRPGASDTRTAEEAGLGRSTTSIFHDTTGGAGRQMAIADLLPSGEQNAVPRAHLRKITGLNDRQLRKEIELERRQGLAICSNNLSGYYMAADDGERERFVNSMLHRAAEIARTAAAIEGGRY